MKSEDLNFLEPSGPLQACNGTALPFTVEVINVAFVRGRSYSRANEYSFRQYISQSEVDWVPVFVMCLVPEPVGQYH